MSNIDKFVKAESNRIEKFNIDTRERISFIEICQKHNIPNEYQKLYFRFEKNFLLDNHFIEFITSDQYDIAKIMTNDGKFARKITDDCYFKLRKKFNSNEVIICDCSVNPISKPEVVEFFNSLDENGYLDNYIQAYSELAFGFSKEKVLKKLN